MVCSALFNVVAYFSDHFVCRMDAVGFQTAYGCALLRLGRTYLEADSVSAVPTWTVSQNRYDTSFSSNSPVQEVLCYDGVEEYEVGRMDW